MTTELSFYPDRDAMLAFPVRPNADTAFVFEDTTPPSQPTSTEELATSCEWFGSALLRAGLLHRWQDAGTAHDRLHNNHWFGPEDLKERERFDIFLLNPEDERAAVLADPESGRLLRQGEFIMQIGQAYRRLGEAIQKFCDGNETDIERDSAPTAFHTQYALKRTLAQPRHIPNIGNVDPVKDATLSFAVPNSHWIYNGCTSNSIFVGVNGEDGIQQQDALDFSYDYRLEPGDRNSANRAPHPLRLRSSGVTMQYRKPNMPYRCERGSSPIIVERAHKVLRYLAVRNAVEKQDASSSGDAQD
jgi:hypothetical protein